MLQFLHNKLGSSEALLRRIESSLSAKCGVERGATHRYGVPTKFASVWPARQDMQCRLLSAKKKVSYVQPI